MPERALPMNQRLMQKLKPVGVVGLGCLLLTGMLIAYPPAPHHTLYGLVRNQWGDPVTIAPSDVFLETPSGTQLRTSMVTGLEPGVNYRLEVPMDSGTAPDLYQPTAMRPFFQYRLKVMIGQTTYLPLQMVGNFSQIGRPSERTRIDLTLGVDSDGDGLPDAWEESLIAVYGGTLGSIRPNDDLDGDGISNLNEYLAGTYAFDPDDGFYLTIVDANAGNATLEFLTLRGRNYKLEASPDLRQWAPVGFRVLNGGTSTGLPRDSYQSSDVRVLRVEVPAQAGGETNRYFKALVQ